MIKKGLLFAVSAILLLCSCERLFESRKERLDRLVGAHWEAWKTDGKDTTMCFVDIAKVVPKEWDTIVYVRYDRFLKYKNDDVINYMNNRYWPENERMKEYPEESLHFWKNGRVVYEISLWLDSENERGVCVYDKNDFLVRDRKDAKFHMEKVEQFYILSDSSKMVSGSKR